jgi:hypothetical protein
MAFVIRLRQGMQRRSRRLLAVGAIASVALLLAIEHSGATSHEMGEGMEVVAGVCLAIVDLVAVSAVVVPLAWRRPRLRPGRGPSPVAAGTYSMPLAPPARAGPALLQVLLR